jgi:hypothetical protein
MKRLKTLAITLIVILTSIGCSNQIEENDWTRDNLKGKIQAYTQFSYEAEVRFGEIKKGKRGRGFHDSDFQKKYDEKGNQIEETYYGSSGSLNWRLTYKYDEKGNQIEKNSYESDGSLDWRVTFKYDEKGNQIEKNSYESDGSLDTQWTYKYEFDEQGNWIKRVEFENEIPQFILIREYEYYK